MRRAELWWADLPPPEGHRPVLLLSRDAAYLTRDLIIITPVTTRVRRIPTEVALGPEEGLRRASVANLDTIQMIAKWRLQERIATLSPQKLQALDAALRFALGLEE